jgi:membrane associated rhomboid family serine protease
LLKINSQPAKLIIALTFNDICTMFKKLLYDTGQLNWLLVIIVAAIAGFLISFFTQMFAGPTALNFFAIHSGDNLSILKIWKYLTYPLADPSVGSMVSNLIWLWIFGDIIAGMLGTKKVFNLFAIAHLAIGILAAVICIFNLPGFKIMLLGCDVGVIAVAAACVYKFPQFKVQLILIGAVPVWVLGAIFILLRVFVFPDVALLPQIVLYLFAIGFGVLYMHLLNQGTSLEAIFSLDTASRKPAKVVQLRNVTPSQQKATTNNQEQLNKILDKISAQGMQALTTSERNFLEDFKNKP